MFARLRDNPIIFIVWYGTLIVLSLITYIAWVRPSKALSSNTQGAYVAFLVIAMAVFFTVGSISFWWAAVKTLTVKERDGKIQLGIGSMFLASDVPFFLINLVMYFNYGFSTNLLQGMDFGLRMISFSFGFLFLWILYIQKFADYFHGRGYNRRPIDAPPGVPYASPHRR
eukprot:gene8101-12459_t